MVLAEHPLSVARIVETALSIADRDGLDGLSMRRLARELGVDPMSIYHHLPQGKEQLFDLLVVAVGTVEQISPRSDVPWPERLRGLARRFRSQLLAHPNLLPLVMTRPVHTDETLAALDEQYAALREAGLRGQEILDASRTLGSYVFGFIALEIQAHASGRTDSDWRRPVLTGFPHLAALDRYQAMRSWDEQFDICLEQVLKGVLPEGALP